MENTELNIWETAYNEQAELLQATERRLKALESELQIHRQRAAISCAKARASKLKKKENAGRTHTFVKVLKTANQTARRDNLFTPAEKQLLFDIMPFIGFDGFVNKEDHSHMTLKDVQELCCWKKNHTIKTLDELCTKGVLERVKEGRNVFLKVSPGYCKCGR